MAQETEEKKFLLLLNEKEGSVRIATYPDQNNPGKAKTVDPKMGKAEDFMTFNGKDGIDEFIDNYRRQNNYPQGLRWLYAPLRKLEEIGNALFKFKNGDHGALGPYRQYETKPYFKNEIAERDLPMKDLRSLGYSEEYLKNPNTIGKLRRREPLSPIKINQKVGRVNFEGMFSPRVVVNPKTGKPMVKTEQCKSADEVLSQPYMGYNFSKKQQEKLKSERHLGEVVTLTDPKTKEPFDALISLHPYTNEPYHADIRKLNIPDHIKDQGIDKDLLLQGGKLKLDNYQSASGKTLSPIICYDAFMKRLDFDFNAFRVPKTIGGVELSPQQQTDYSAGKRVDLGEPTNKNGSAQKPIIYQGGDGKMRRDGRNAQEQTAYDEMKRKHDVKKDHKNSNQTPKTNKGIKR